MEDKESLPSVEEVGSLDLLLQVQTELRDLANSQMQILGRASANLVPSAAMKSYAVLHGPVEVIVNHG